MKKIFNIGKKGQSSSSSFKLSSYFSNQTRLRYRARSKDLGKIHKAALLGKVEKVQQLLLLGKGTINELDKRKRTPLHLASANGHLDVVSLLIERKCELNLLDDQNKTPLMKAIECQDEACATILLEHGADPNLKDRNSNTILHYIASSETKFMAEKLIKYKIDIEAKNKDGLTPLMVAIKAKNNDMATILLKNGANANAMDGSKRTALMLAVSMEALGLVTLLLQNNADHTLKDSDGWTAEQYAKLYGYPVYVYHKQVEKQMIQIEELKEQIEEEEPCTSQIRTSAPSLDKKAQENIVEDSISRCSDSSGSLKSWKSTDDELDFDKKEQPKLNLVKLMNAKISGETSSSVSTKVTTALEDNQLDNEKKDLTDSFAKSSSQAHCSTHAVVHASPAHFSQSSLNKPTLLGIFKEYPRDSEEAKENDVFVKNDTDNQIYPNIPGQLQAHNTSEKHAERKATKSTSKRSKEEAKSSWDSECSVENPLEGSSRHLASINQNINKSISLGREDHPGKNHNMKPSQCGLPIKDSSTSQELEKSVKPKPKLAFMEKVDLSVAEDTDDHPGKNRNVKTSQSGLPMKDSSTSQQSEKGVKAKQKSEVMGKVDLTAAENTDDGSNWDSPSTSEIHKSHRSSKILNLRKSDVGKSLLRALNKLGSTRTAAGSGPEEENPGPQKQCEPPLEKEAQKDHPGKNHNVKPSQCGLPMKDSSTSQESEKVVKPKRKLAFMEKVDLSAAENTDDHPGKHHNVKPSQCALPMKDSSTSQELEKSDKPKPKLAFVEKVDLSVAEDPDDHPGKNRTVKTSQSGLPMKDSSTSHQSEKGVKAKQKSEIMGKVDLSAAENTDDGSNWDSPSTSEIHKSHRSSKILNLRKSDVGKSLLRALNKLGSTRTAAVSGPEEENPGPQKQCEPPLEKEAQKDHPGKNHNVKTSQSGLPIKDSSTSQQSEKGVKPKRKLAFMEKLDLSAAEKTDDHPGKHRNVKPSQCGLPMKDSSTSQELEKSDKPKPKLAFMEKVDLSVAEDPDDHPGKNRNVKTTQSGLPMKDSSTSQQSEKGVKAKQKSEVMGKVDLSAAENTDDGSNWDSPSTSEIHKSHRSSKILNLRKSDFGKSLLRALNKLGSTRTAAGSGPEEENPGPQKQCEPPLEKEAQKDHPGKNRNVKTSQSGLPMKDSSTSQQSEKGVKAKQKLEVMGKVDLTAAENTDDGSNWDSPSTSEIHKSNRSSKILNLRKSDVGKSLLRALNKLGSTRTAAGSGPEVENPGPQKQCEPPLEKEAKKDHPGKNHNVKTSQSGLHMKDSSTSQQSEKGVKAKQKLEVMEKVDFTAAENTDDHPGKNRNMKASQCSLPMKDSSTSQESEKVVKPKRKLAFMEKVDLNAAENTDDHPGKNPNVKPRQCGLLMKDSSTRQELEKSFKPKPKLAFMEKVDLSAAEDTDDHPGKNRNVKPSQCGLPMKDSSTSQELEKSDKPKPKLAFMEKVDLSAAENTDDHPGKNRNVKTSQSGLPMKDSSTSQESEKGVKGKQKLEVMGKVDLSAAENTDDGSNWDSPSTSEIHKSNRSSKILNLRKSDVGKSLLRALNKLGSTRTAAVSGPEVENPGPQKQCKPPLEKEAKKDHPGKNRNVKTSQSGLPMKDSSTSQESERLFKTKQKLDVMGKFDLTAAENTDDGSNWDSPSTSEIHKSHKSSMILNLQRSDVGKSLLRSLNKLGSRRVAAGSGLEVENPGPQKQCEPPLEKEAQKDHPGKNRNVKTSQSCLPMKDSSTSQESERLFKKKQKLDDVEIFDLTAAENTDDGSNWDSTSTSEIHNSHRSSKTLNLQRSDAGKSLPVTGSGPDTGYKVGVQVENPGSQKQCEPPLEKAQKHHTGKNPNVKTSQCGLPMKDSSTNQESEKGVKAKPKLAFMEKVDLTAAENADEGSNWDSTSTSAIHKSHRSSKTLNLQRSDVGKSLPVTGSGPDSGYKVGVQVENPGSQKQCEPPLEKAQKHHTGKNANVKTSQSGLPMKDSSTNQESEKGVKAKPKLAFMEKVDLTAAENTDEGSNWDSTSTSAIHKSHRSSKTLNLQRSDVGKSLPVTGSGPDSGYKVGVQVENPGSQKQCEPPLEKAQKHHTGKNPNMKTSQSGLPMKDSSTSQGSERLFKTKQKLDDVEIFDLTAEENTDEGSNWDSTSTSAIHKSHTSSKTLNLQRSDVGKSLPMTGSGPDTGYKVGVQVENPGSQKQYEPHLEKAQKHHTGKNPNVKTSQCGLPMKDSSTNQESEKGVKAKPKLDDVEIFDLTAPENTDDGSNWDSTSTSAIHKSHRSSKNLILQRSDVGKSFGTLNKLSSTRAAAGSGPEVENPGPQKQCEPLLEKEAQKDLIPKPEFKGSSDRNQGSFDKRNQGQCFPENLTKFERRLKDNSSLGQHEGHLSRNSNEKPIQSTLQTSQEVVKRSKEKPELDTSTWDSTDTYEINDRHKSSMHLKLQRTHACTSLSQSKNQLASTEFPFKKAEVAATGSGSDTRSKVRVEKPVPQEHCKPPIRKEKQEEDLNREMEFKTSLGPSQERFNQDQGKVTLQTTNITEQTTPKNQIKSCAPFLNQKRISQGVESNIKFHGDDMPLGPQRNWKESCEKICVKEEKIVKSKFRMNQTGIYGETCEKDNIADQPKEKLQKDDFENKSEEELSDTSSSATLTYMSDPREKKKEEELSETSSSATLTYMSNPREKKKEKSPYSVKDFQSIPGQLSNNMCSKKSTSQFKNDSKPKTEYTSKVNEENVASVAKNIIKVDSKIDINGIKEDRPFGTEMTYSQHRNISSVEPNSGNLFQSNFSGSHFGGQLIQSDNMKSSTQEEKPKVTSPRKCKKKTKHLEPLDEYNYYNDYNSIYEPSDEMDSFSYWDQVSRMYLTNDIGEDIKRYRNELRILQAEALTLEKLKKQSQKEVEKKRQEHQQKKMETLRRKDGNSTESHHHGKDEGNKIPGKEMSTFSEEYLVFTQILRRLAKKIFNKKNEDKVEMAEDAVDDLTQAHATGSVCVQTSEKIVVTSSLSIKHQKNTKFVKITRVLESIQSTVRETQERRKNQSSLKHECDKEHHRSRLEGEKENKEKPQSEVKIISYKSSAIYQKHQTLKEKNQDSLFIKNRIDALSNRYSKAKNELRKLLHALKVKTSLIAKTQKQVQQVKDKVKKRRLENHMLKEKFKRAVLQEERLQEKLNEMQKEIPLPQPSENAQKKGAFIKEAFKNIGMRFRDRSVTVDADIEEQDHVAEERNEQIRIHEKELEEKRNEQIRIHEKELEEERNEQIRIHEKELEEKRNEQIRIHEKELEEERNEQIRIHEKELEEERNKQIRIYEKELEEDEETIRKLQEQVAESQKETFIFAQTALEMKQIWKKYERECELYEYHQQNKRKKQHIKDMEDYLQKLKYATSENSGEQTDKNEELWDATNSYFEHIRHLEEKVEAESSKKFMLELLYRKLQEETIALQSLREYDDNLKWRRKGI